VRAQVDRQEDALDERADDALGTAWDDLWSGDLFANGVSLSELHVLLGLSILAMAVLRLVWRRAGGLPPWATALNAVERFLEAWVEKGLLLLLFVIPVTGLLMVAGGERLGQPAHRSAHRVLRRRQPARRAGAEAHRHPA
jgi:cytochrome b561